MVSLSSIELMFVWNATRMVESMWLDDLPVLGI